MRTVLAAAAGIATDGGSAGSAQTVYPIDRAEMLSGARFDFKVEFPGLADPSKVSITLNGEDYAKVFGKAGSFVEREDGKDQSALLLRDVSLAKPGIYSCASGRRAETRELRWNGLRYRAAQGEECHPVHRRRHVARAPRRGAHSSPRALRRARRTASSPSTTCRTWRWSRRPAATSIITDSANSASAYTTGHKSAVNAMGVYADRTRDPLDDPRVETITSLAQRRHRTWRSASSPIPRSRTRRPRPWWRIPVGAPNTTASSSSISPPSPTCSWAAVGQLPAEVGERLASAGTMPISSRNSATAATRLR